MTNIFDLLKSKEDPIGGLYIHVLQPNETIFEPGKQIEKGMCVIKHGKFLGKLSDRMKSYFSPKYWHNKKGEAAFESAVISSYLIFDATKLPKQHRWLLAGLEVKVGQLIDQNFDVIGKIGKRSEYRQIDLSNSSINFFGKISNISFEIYSLVQKVVGGDFYPLMNCKTFDDDMFYLTSFFCELHEDLKKNRNLILRLLPDIWVWEDKKSFEEIKKSVRDNFGGDPDFFKEALAHAGDDSSCLVLANDTVLNDKDVILSAVQSAAHYGGMPIVEIFASENLKRDQPFLEAVLDINIDEFDSIGTCITEKRILLKVLKRNGLKLEFINDAFKNDIELIKTAIKNNPNAIEFVPENLKSTFDASFL